MFRLVGPPLHAFFGRGLRRLRKSEGGQAAFEFLLMLPMFILFMLLIVDLGMAMYSYVSISNSVREGARYGSVNCNQKAGGCTASDVQTWTTQHLGGLKLLATDTVAASWSGHDRGDQVAVSITHKYEFKFFPPVTLTEHACAVMRLEQQDENASLSGGGTC